MLAAIPLRIWLALGAVLAVAGLLWHDHIGWQKAKARNIEISNLKITLKQERKAKVAEVAHVKENATTTELRAADPLHGGLCVNPTVQARAAKPVNAGPRASAADVQPVPEGDPGASGQPDPDVRHLLDVLAGRADAVSAELREWQAR